MFRSRMQRNHQYGFKGYPGETEEDFQKTLEMMQEVRFIDLCIQVLHQTWNRAAEEENQLSDQIKSERLRILLETHEGFSEKQEFW